MDSHRSLQLIKYPEVVSFCTNILVSVVCKFCASTNDVNLGFKALSKVFCPPGYCLAQLKLTHF
jgi:hypothetical protein